MYDYINVTWILYMFVFKCTYISWTGAKMSEHGMYIYIWPVDGQFIEKLWWTMGWNGVIEFRTHIWKCTNMLFVSAVSFNCWCSKPYLMWWIFNLGNPTWGWLDYFTNISGDAAAPPTGICLQKMWTDQSFRSLQEQTQEGSKVLHFEWEAFMKSGFQVSALKWARMHIINPKKWTKITTSLANSFPHDRTPCFRHTQKCTYQNYGICIDPWSPQSFQVEYDKVDLDDSRDLPTELGISVSRKHNECVSSILLQLPDSIWPFQNLLIHLDSLPVRNWHPGIPYIPTSQQ